MIERLPTPWGLVRSGVAPDHPKIKSVTRIYEKTAAHPCFRYFGNVTLRRARLARGPAGALPRDRLRHRVTFRPAPGDPRRRASRLARCHRFRRLVQRPSRPHAAGGGPAARPSAPWSSATATSRSTSRACSCSRLRSSRPPTPPTMPWRCSPPARSTRSSSSDGVGPPRLPSPTPSCWSWASSPTPT